MWPQGPPNTKEILKISRRTTDIIQSRITPNVCLFGSAAAFLWTDTGRRVPNDIDILVNTSYDAEQIKEIIVDADDRYFLKRARRRSAQYKVLWCRLPGWRTPHRRCVKVDILVPPCEPLGLPEILASDTPVIENIPVMPLFDLLVLKTQGWWDHRVSPRKDLRAKEDGDVDDVDALLDRAVEEDVDYELVRGRHTSGFMHKALLLARRFVSVLRGRRGEWKAIGFPL